MREGVELNPDQIKKIQKEAEPAAAAATAARQKKKAENRKIYTDRNRQRNFRKSSPYSGSDVRIASQAKYRRTVH